jgi:hypothetical protein
VHPVIVFKFVVAKILYQCWEHMIVAWFQIRAVCGMFKDFSAEMMQGLLSRCGTVWLNITMQEQNTFTKQSRAFIFSECS